MDGKYVDDRPRSATEWFDLGCLYRKNAEFGMALNAFRSAVEAAGEELSSGLMDREAYAELVSRSEATCELILRITGFVNKDLMNP